ncbi:MAG: hypothetical protein ABS46_05900 [Cytophagaceae bacterium SCN 52-12]|nr:MAG: hypothetical protein ABS46_05900 [Cytophagaceae bacterium SCN 52-12]
MRLLGKRADQDTPLEDPISGVANLFDLSVVLIVAMIFALVSTLDMLDMFSGSDVTYTKQAANGEIEIIEKKGKEIKVKKITKDQSSGKGERLGTAYKLEDGQVIYVPE